MRLSRHINQKRIVDAYHGKRRLSEIIVLGAIFFTVAICCGLLISLWAVRAGV